MFFFSFFTQQIINSPLALEDITCRINFCYIPAGRLFIFSPPLHLSAETVYFSHRHSLRVAIITH